MKTSINYETRTTTIAAGGSVTEAIARREGTLTYLGLHGFLLTSSVVVNDAHGQVIVDTFARAH